MTANLLKISANKIIDMICLNALNHKFQNFNQILPFVPLMQPSNHLHDFLIPDIRPARVLSATVRIDPA